jgi:carbon-monoxide dehydrogenase small subunit
MEASIAAGEETRNISCVVNGRAQVADVPVRELLSDFLRHTLGLTGTHVGCEHGVCGACTVMVDGQPVRSCLMLGVQVDGAEVTTVEGFVGPNGEMHPVMDALMEANGLQCGFCTPGFVIRIINLLEENPQPTREEIVEGLAGNLCRCTGYQTIVNGVEIAAAKLNGDR